MAKVIIDLDPNRCVACYACVVACQDQHYEDVYKRQVDDDSRFTVDAIQLGNAFKAGRGNDGKAGHESGQLL